MQNGGGIGKGH
jgi:hypothetical protein